MRIELPREAQRFGANLFYGVQKVYELNAGLRGDAMAYEPYFVIKQVPYETINEIENRMAIVVPLKSERLRLLEGVLFGIPHPCPVIVVSNSPREPVDRFNMEKQAIENFRAFTKKNLVVVHQKDPVAARAFIEAGYDELIGDDGLIRQELNVVRAELGLDFRTYAELSPDELGRLAGLRPDAASRALRRDYSETLVGLFSDSQSTKLNEALRAKGLEGARGSRFFTVTSSWVNKGLAVGVLMALFRDEMGEITSIGLGDGENDLPMLNAVDHAFLMRKSNGDRGMTGARRLETVPGQESAAWNTIINSLLDRHL